MSLYTFRIVKVNHSLKKNIDERNNDFFVDLKIEDFLLPTKRGGEGRTPKTSKTEDYTSNLGLLYSTDFLTDSLTH